MDPISATIATAGAVHGAAMAAAKYADAAKKGAAFVRDTSLTDVTSLARVEPLTILSNDLVNFENTKDILMTLNSLFAGYYLQAVNLSMRLKDVENVRLLDRLNPNRDGSGWMLEGSIRGKKAATEGFGNPVIEVEARHITFEDMKYRLPTTNRPSVSMEADGGDLNLEISSNLSIGKVINLELQVEGADGKVKTTTMPVSIRLMVTPASAAVVETIFTYGKGEELTLKDRFQSWQAGRIEFWRDLVFAQDLIENYNKALISDSSNVLAEIGRRRTNAKKWGALTANPSLASASTLVVMSEVIAKSIEQKVRGKWSNAGVRKHLFSQTGSMVVAIVDREWGQVTFYVRGAERGTSLTFKEIQSKNKGGGPDVMDIFKTLLSGGAPTF